MNIKKLLGGLFLIVSVSLIGVSIAAQGGKPGGDATWKNLCSRTSRPQGEL